MRHQGDNMGAEHEETGLTSARNAGYRVGMSSSTVIGVRLGRIFPPPHETPARLQDLLAQLDRMLGGAG